MIGGWGVRIAKFCGARKLVGQQNFGWDGSVHFEIAQQRWPRSAGARAQIHDALATALLEPIPQQGRDRLIGIGDFQIHLQRVHELVAQKLWKPRLFVNFKESRNWHKGLLQDCNAQAPRASGSA